MLTRPFSICAAGLCALLVASASAANIYWDSQFDGFWDRPSNWEPQQRPGPNDDAKHLYRFSAIKLRFDEWCQSFEGNGNAPADRFLLIESGKRWTVGQDLYETNGGGETPNFIVKFEDGQGLLERTELFVYGDVSRIDLVPDASGGHVGDVGGVIVYGELSDSTVTLRDSCIVGFNSISNSTVTVRDDCAVNVQGPLSNSVIRVQDGCNVGLEAEISDCQLILGDSLNPGAPTFVEILGNITGFPLLALYGNTELFTEGNITATSPDDSAVIVGPVTVRLGDVYYVTVDGGNWTVAEGAEVKGTVTNNFEIVRGRWSVIANASVEGHRLKPDELVVDAAFVSAGELGDPRTPWDLTIRNGGDVWAWLPTFPDVNDVVSTVTYAGLNNTLSFARDLQMHGALQKGELPTDSGAASLEIQGTVSLVFGTKTVRVRSGETIVTPFDSEDVTLIAGEVENEATNLEVFSPDYELATNGPLFVDSPCVRRWNRVTAANDPNSADGVALMDTASSTPISGGTQGSPPTGLMAEALYAKGLVVETGAVLRVGTDPNRPDLNIYYTGTVTNNGSILDRNGNPYTPIKLTPTLYGDFDGDGEGNDPADVARFNAAFPSVKGDPEYDALVDWDCDGDIDCDDWDQYIANWLPGAQPCQ